MVERVRAGVALGSDTANSDLPVGELVPGTDWFGIPPRYHEIPARIMNDMGIPESAERRLRSSSWSRPTKRLVRTNLRLVIWALPSIEISTCKSRQPETTTQPALT
jgi:hypothetical protein